MAHPYPPHWAAFPYVGHCHYFLTFVTDARRPVFVAADAVNLVLQHILRAATEKRFAITAYCFMSDHLHLIISGEDDQADCKAFIKAAKQYSGYYYSQSQRARLWDRYGHDRVIRDELELAMSLRYLVANPVRAGLVAHPRDYPFLGSAKYTVQELLQWCEYSDATVT
jgi:REP element-mobilizing transposase RayT